MRDGLTTQRLRTVTELTLRSAGIFQSREDIWAKSSQNPKFREAYLYVRVNTMEDDGLYVYCVEVELREIVKLVDGPGRARGTIWDAGSFGMIGSDNLRNLVETAKRHVERFANDYLAANPRNQ